MRAQNIGVHPPEVRAIWKNAIRLLVPVGAILYVFSRFIPTTPTDDYPLVAPIDDNWTLAIHDAFARHLQFGRDLIFTCGPWGFLWRGYYPPTYLISVAAWGILTLGFIIAGRRLVRNLVPNHFLSWCWLIGFAGAASLPVGFDMDARLIAWTGLLLYLRFFVEKDAFSVNQAALVVSLGCLSLVKFTGMIESLAVLLVITMSDVFQHHRWPWNLLLWVASVLGFWILAGQQLGLLVPYLHYSWLIASGYTEAMMMPRHGNLLDMGGFLLLALFLCLLTARLAWERDRYWGLLPLAGLGAILFNLFKLAYVRNDTHEIAAASGLLLVSWMILAVAWPRRNRNLVAALLLVIASTGFASAMFHRWIPSNGLAKQMAESFKPYYLLAPLESVSSDYMEKAYEKNLDQRRKQSPLPAIEGGTDIYSYDQATLFAHGLRYQPRPILQSYAAYTPELTRLNAEWLDTDRAASNILFAIQTIDGRFPALDDGLSWPELLTRYELVKNAEPDEIHLLLARSASPRSYHFTPLTNTVASWGESMAVPVVTNGPVWVEMEIKRTFIGSFCALFYKPPVLRMTVLFRNHESRTFRLIPGMAQSGFLVSPVIANAQSFAALFLPGWQHDLAGLEVSTISISSDTSSGATSCYESPLKFRFSCLEYSPPNP